MEKEALAVHFISRNEQTTIQSTFVFDWIALQKLRYGSVDHFLKHLFIVIQCKY